MPPGRRGRARGAPARGCISITRPAVTGGSEPQRGGGGEGHYLWGGGLPGPQGYRMGRAAGASGAWGLRSAAGCGKPHAQGARTRACAYHPGVRALGAGLQLGLRWPRAVWPHAPRGRGRGLGSRMVRPSPWGRISKGRAPTPPFGAGIIIKILYS